jgi:hypothetical protein
MNIPESAILPFEPLCIPKIGVLRHGSVTEALDEAFEIMNRRGTEDNKPIGVDAIKLFLLGVLNDYKATLDTIYVTGWSGRIVVVDITYSINRGLVGYVGYVKSDNGFKRPSRGS